MSENLVQKLKRRLTGRSGTTRLPSRGGAGKRDDIDLDIGIGGGRHDSASGDTGSSGGSSDSGSSE